MRAAKRGVLSHFRLHFPNVAASHVAHGKVGMNALSDEIRIYVARSPDMYKHMEALTPVTMSFPAFMVAFMGEFREMPCFSFIHAHLIVLSVSTRLERHHSGPIKAFIPAPEPFSAPLNQRWVRSHGGTLMKEVTY